MKKTFIITLNLLWVAIITCAQLIPSKSEVIQVMKKVNDYWIAQNPSPGNNQWARAAYFTGNVDFYKIYPKEKYLNYALLWANNNGWSLNGGTSTRNADNQTCGQVYIDLYKLDPNSPESRISAIKTSIDNMVRSNTINDWWWIDALYMSMPVFARLGDLNQDNRYFDKMYQLYTDSKVSRGLYNVSDSIWYRDGNFMQANDTTPSGKKIYWSRGNGWVLAAHVRVLQLLPENHINREEYIRTFQEMAASLKKRQQPDGFWYANLDDPKHYGGPETSGTSFFTYGLAWGINNGILDKTTYLPVVQKAWNALTTISVQSSGLLAYVQGVGSEPKSSQPVTVSSTADFGVGAFLLAGTEMVKLASGEMPVPTNMNLVSATPLNKKQLEVRFSKKTDPVSALNINNYQVDNNIAVINVHVGRNDSCVILQTSDLFPGKFKLTVQNIKDENQQSVETGENISFSYTDITTVTASGYEPNTTNTPDKTLDYDLGTRWSCEGKGVWILYDLGETKQVYSVDLAFFSGASRKAFFKIQLSTNLADTTDVFNGASSGTTSNPESYTFIPVNARYIRIIGYGNSASNWNSITETRINYLEYGTTLQNQFSSNEITVYPNPSDGKDLHIKSNTPAGEISIKDISGKTVFQQSILVPEKHINLKNLPLSSGVYFIQAENKIGKLVIR